MYCVVIGIGRVIAGFNALQEACQPHGVEFEAAYKGQTINHSLKIACPLERLDWICTYN